MSPLSSNESKPRPKCSDTCRISSINGTFIRGTGFISNPSSAHLLPSKIFLNNRLCSLKSTTNGKWSWNRQRIPWISKSTAINLLPLSHSKLSKSTINSSILCKKPWKISWKRKETFSKDFTSSQMTNYFKSCRQSRVMNRSNLTLKKYLKISFLLSWTKKEFPWQWSVGKAKLFH